jgi:putative transposase
MTWRASCPMDERMAFIREMIIAERTMSDLCRIFGVSRKTGHKWWNRYCAEGSSGLQERSRAAHHHPNAVDARLASALLSLRKRHPDWGPQTLLDSMRLQDPSCALPHPSTVAELLRRHGLVKLRRKRARSVPYAAPFTRASAPNELWSADYKGQFRMGDRRYCYPLTISDSYSRYLLCCEGLPGPTLAQTQPYFERAFRQYGLPAAIRTDNGAPFASIALGGVSPLSLWWLKLGIVPERIRPAHPQQNARHERMHGTLKLACPVQADLSAQRRALHRFQREYNQERPHRSLGGQTPQMHYQASPRSYPRRLPELVYPAGFQVRKAHHNGEITWHSKRWYVSQIVAQEPIGLYPIADGVWRVHVGMLAVGILDLRNKRIEPIETFIHVPTRH